MFVIVKASALILHFFYGLSAGLAKFVFTQDKIMANNPSTPFWLEIKTEYIDANLEKVIAYLSRESSEPGTDSFYEETQKLLGKRVRELIRSLASTPIGQEDEKGEK